MIKKLSKLMIIILLLTLVVGCGVNDEKKSKEKEKNNDKIDEIDEVTDSTGTLKCKRSASVTNGTGTFNYTIKYKDKEITYIQSKESITMDDSSSLQEYVDAYNSIKANYKNIKNYYSKVTTDENTVTYEIIIDYNKVDAKDLIALEGEEDNIYEDGKPMLEKWLSFAKKLGVTCSEE